MHSTWRDFAWTGHTQPAEFPLPTLKSIPATPADGRLSEEAVIRARPPEMQATGLTSTRRAAPLPL
jgi:hypothetical protein